MAVPPPFAWPWTLVFWPVYSWVFLPKARIVRCASFTAEDRGSLRVVKVGSGTASVSAFLLAFVVPQASLPGNPLVWLFFGVATLVAASLLRRHCFRILGTFFTVKVTIQPGHHVIETGAYRWVRHP